MGFFRAIMPRSSERGHTVWESGGATRRLVLVTLSVCTPFAAQQAQARNVAHLADRLTPAAGYQAQQRRRCLSDTTDTSNAADSETIDTIAPGLVYRCRRIAHGPWLMHVVSIDLRKAAVGLEAVRATDHMRGRERVSDMARRLASAGRAPLVAINADFFDLATGEIENNNVVHGDWVKGVLDSDSPHDEFDNAHTQLAIDARGLPHIARFRLAGTVTARGRSAPLVGINYRPPHTPGLVLYTSYFGALTPSDSQLGARVDRPIDPDARPGAALPNARSGDSVRPPPSVSQLRADSARRASLQATAEAMELPLTAVGRLGDTLMFETGAPSVHHGGGTAIPPNGALLSATGEARAFVMSLAGGTPGRASDGGQRFARMRVKVVAALTATDRRTRDESARLTPMAVVGGWPGLVREGKNVGALADSIEGTFPRFSAARHPRSAAALSRDGNTLYLVVVDGRRPWSVGMSLTEFAQELIALGAWRAMNFDGGGSSTLWIAGEVVNYPSDPTGERAVGNALVVLPAARAPMSRTPRPAKP